MFVSDKFPTYELNRTKIDHAYLRWYFRCPDLWEQALKLSTGSAAISKLTLNPPKFKELTIPLPTLPEQRRIVEKIERLAAKIEEIQGLRLQLEKTTSVLWKSEALKVFECINKKYWHPLGKLVEIGGGGTPSKQNPVFWNGVIPWISPKDMKGKEIFDSADHITEEGLRASPVKLYEPGAVLIVVRGMILVHTFPTAILRVHGVINQDMKALKPYNETSPEYLCMALWGLNDRLLELVDRSSHDTRKLTTPKLKAFSIPIPSLEEQRRIVGYLTGFQEKVDRLKELQRQTMVEIDVLLPSLLDKAFKGEL